MVSAALIDPAELAVGDARALVGWDIGVALYVIHWPSR